MHQMLFYDEDRYALYQAAGVYSNATQRIILSSQTTTINSLRVSDTTGTTYLLGTATTFALPYFNGGTPALSGTTPCLILQQFTVLV